MTNNKKHPVKFWISIIFTVLFVLSLIYTMFSALPNANKSSNNTVTNMNSTTNEYAGENVSKKGATVGYYVNLAQVQITKDKEIQGNAVITSMDELNKYFSKYKDEATLTSGQFVTSSYNDAFFEDNTLIIVANSSQKPYYYTVSAVTIGDSVGNNSTSANVYVVGDKINEGYSDTQVFSLIVVEKKVENAEINILINKGE